MDEKARAMDPQDRPLSPLENEMENLAASQKMLENSILELGHMLGSVLKQRLPEGGKLENVPTVEPDRSRHVASVAEAARRAYELHDLVIFIKKNLEV